MKKIFVSASSRMARLRRVHEVAANRDLGPGHAGTTPTLADHSAQTTRIVLPNAGLELEMGRRWIGIKPITSTLRSRWIPQIR